MILKADKGTSVAKEREAYLRKTEELLDATAYNQIDKNPTCKVEHKVNKSFISHSSSSPRTSGFGSPRTQNT